MRSPLIVIIQRIGRTKNNLAGRTSTNLSHVYVVNSDKGEGEKITQFPTVLKLQIQQEIGMLKFENSVAYYAVEKSRHEYNIYYVLL